MRWAGARRMALLAPLALLLAGCTLGSVGSGLPSGTASSPSSTTAPSRAATTSTSGGPRPAWQQTVNFASNGTAARPIHVRVLPLVRLTGGVLLTVELSLQDMATSTGVFSPFCTGESCRDLSGISLIDTTSRTRFGPLRAGQDGPVMTSSVRSFAMRPGMTYRLGAVFADPGTASVAVDLQQAGVALAVPITTGFPASNLISTQPPPADDWDPDPVTSGTTVTAPVPAVLGSFDQNRHALVGKIVGGPVDAAPGLVTIGSDRLFRPGTATLTPSATALITRAAAIVAAGADPSRPVSIAAYTDPSGTAALTRKQARAVAGKLSGRLEQFDLTQRGGGSADPVAANTTSAGGVSARGRALNRRIELSFTPQDAGDVPLPTSTGSPASTPQPTSTATPSTETPGTETPGTETPGTAMRIVGPAEAEPGTGARFTAQIESVRVDGTMTLVRLRMRSDVNANPVGAFSARGGRRTDVGAFSLVDRTAGRVYVPMADAGNPGRVTGVYTHRFGGGVSYEYTFFTTALPANLTSVDVGLAGLGMARSIAVSR